MADPLDLIRKFGGEARDLTPEQRIKRLFPVGMRSQTDVTIELKCGFELFNTRPYHNYETWSNGWYATWNGKHIGMGETLDDLATSLERWANGEPYTSQPEASYDNWKKVANGTA